MATSGTAFDNGQFWVNQNDYDGAGDCVDWHPHRIPHTTIVRFGRCRILLDYGNGRIESHECGPADRAIHVPAEALHRIECIEGPARTECMFLHRDHEWKIRDKYCGFMAAYG